MHYLSFEQESLPSTKLLLAYLRDELDEKTKEKFEEFIARNHDYKSVVLGMTLILEDHQGGTEDWLSEVRTRLLKLMKERRSARQTSAGITKMPYVVAFDTQGSHLHIHYCSMLTSIGFLLIEQFFHQWSRIQLELQFLRGRLRLKSIARKLAFRTSQS